MCAQFYASSMKRERVVKDLSTSLIMLRTKFRFILQADMRGLLEIIIKFAVKVISKMFQEGINSL